MKPGMTLDDITDDLLLECASLVKANSIVGCKKNNVYVVYTRWKNLKKTNSMVDGQVGFHRPENVRRMNVEKNNPIVNALNKTKVERHPDLCKEQQDRLKEIQAQKRQHKRMEDKKKRIEELQRKKEKEERSYDRIMTSDNMRSNKGSFIQYNTSCSFLLEWKYICQFCIEMLSKYSHDYHALLLCRYTSKCRQFCC